jgi:transposase InsO family protein
LNETEGLAVGVGVLCKVAGMTRQNYYKQRSLRQKEEIDETLILELVRRERCRHRQIGVRKLHFLLSPEFVSAGVEVGRDRLFRLLSRHNLLIERKRHTIHTTQSWHGFGVFPNTAKSMTLSGSHQLLVSDITYIRTMQGFMFLCLVMDMFSRAIVGYDGSDSLEMEGALRALAMAQKQLPAWSRPTHHSDRGSQYCCGAYISQLKKRQMGISMTEENHCYENAHAERLNGILKQEYGLGDTFVSKAEVAGAVKEAVNLYNHWRPHGALDNRIPMQVHRESTAQILPPIAWGVPQAMGGVSAIAQRNTVMDVTTLDQDLTKGNCAKCRLIVSGLLGSRTCSTRDRPLIPAFSPAYRGEGAGEVQVVFRGRQAIKPRWAAW